MTKRTSSILPVCWHKMKVKLRPARAGSCLARLACNMYIKLSKEIRNKYLDDIPRQENSCAIHAFWYCSSGSESIYEYRNFFLRSLQKLSFSIRLLVSLFPGCAEKKSFLKPVTYRTNVIRKPTLHASKGRTQIFFTKLQISTGKLSLLATAFLGLAPIHFSGLATDLKQSNADLF